ncbi:hypothetical protein LTR56_023840 [Elasticomyces elasticus]|nr:hypothetical protein LTR56_023840 [Elasticomyces elasticus]KAK3624425.1 hypothetical protein LTR22_023958 [Elasticomyces elasticus]KAK4906403.1 hypothetical protein LTR49_024425 [Elasticomyces elasticus]KAK5747336.1 hypothetical protein LTS12_022391 [Elasticomyces elasticus]
MAIHQSSHEANHAIPEELLAGLDPEWVTLWNEHGRKQLRADEVSVENYRKDSQAYSFTFPTYTGPAVFHEEEMNVQVSKPAGVVKVRVYTPEGPGPFPVHLNYHGGGWVLGGLNSEAAWCRSVCNKLGIKIIDVDYRMAPEYPFPTAIYDSWEVVKWALSSASKLNIKADSVSIGGLSAGGHMSAVMSHMARDDGVHLKLALMVVPSVDLRWSIAEEPIRSQVRSEYPSVDMVSNNPWGPEKRMDWFMS